MKTLSQIDEKAFIQGTDEWLALRRWKITATDAAVILGENRFKTASELFDEKLFGKRSKVTAAMQRGSDFEEDARKLFIIKTGIFVEPCVRISNKNPWMMASLDGIDVTNSHIVEIKCPGEKTHNTAKNGKVPEYYYGQLQHQMAVCSANAVYYFSFDGFDGVVIKVERNDQYIDKMIEEEKKFYDRLMEEKEALGIA